MAVQACRAREERAKRVAEAMLNMVKLDIEALRSAYEGRSA